MCLQRVCGNCSEREANPGGLIAPGPGFCAFSFMEQTPLKVYFNAHITSYNVEPDKTYLAYFDLRRCMVDNMYNSEQGS